MDEQKSETKVNLKLEADAALRTGKYANGFMLQSNTKEVILDAYFIDNVVDAENSEKDAIGTVTSRIVMSPLTLLEMQGMINTHIENNHITVDKKE